MTYKTAINKFQSLYHIGSLVKGSKELKLGDKDIFMLLADAYSYLANKHKLIQKYSTDNATPQVNLVAGQDTYTSGTGATNIPSDLGDVYTVTLNDTEKTPLTKLNITSLQGTVKASGKPSGYGIDKTNKILVLDALPTASYAADNSMRLIIHYTARIEPYAGTFTGSYAKDNPSDADFLASFDTDDHWSHLIVLWALGEVLPEKKAEAMKLENDLIRSRPAFFNYELPYYSGVYEELPGDTPGDDTGRGI